MSNKIKNINQSDRPELIMCVCVCVDFIPKKIPLKNMSDATHAKLHRLNLSWANGKRIANYNVVLISIKFYPISVVI